MQIEIAVVTTASRAVLNQRKTQSGQAAKKIKKWRFEEQMLFIKSHLQGRETHTNLDEPQESEQEEERDNADNEYHTKPNSDLAEALTTSIKTRTKLEEKHLAAEYTYGISSRYM